MRLPASIVRNRPLRILVRLCQVAAILLAIGLVGATAAGIVYLTQVSRNLPELDPLEYGEVAVWKQHTEVYADTPPIVAGTPWTTLKRRMERLDYAPVTADNLREGTYSGQPNAGDSTVQVFPRAFIHPRIRQNPQAFVVAIRDGAVADVQQADGASVGRFFLEPELVDELYNVDEGLARQLIALEEAPKHLIDAFIAIEDNDFYKHPGIHARRFAVTMFWNVVRNRRYGASTITQQLARNLMLTRQKILLRKAKEWLLAVQIERRYSKNEILERYLNFIDMGRHSGRSLAGVKEAARYYFNKDVAELSLSECALLASIPKSPTRYSPVLHPENARERRNLILRQMHRRGYISRADMIAAQAEELVVEGPRRSRFRGTAPYFGSYIRALLEQRYSREQLYNQGMRVYTTMDPIAQDAGTRIVAKELEELDKQLRYPPYRDMVAAADAKLSAKHEPGDYIQAGLVMIEVQTGYVRAIVGGRDYDYSQFNHVTQAKRQPGSAFKPFVYTAAWERGMKPSDTIEDEPWTYRGWTPHNISFSHEGEVDLRRALVRSLNIPAARLMNEYVGVTATVRMARRCGIETPLAPYPSLALGSSEVTPLEITSAYGTLANGGVRVKSIAIRYVVDSSGRVLEEQVPETSRVMEEWVAYTTTSVLQDVVTYGTGARVRRLGFTYPAAGKTGTTSDYTDAWFIGYTPHVVTGVWVGFDDPKKSVKATGSEAAIPIWTEFMKEAIRGPKDAFVAPGRRSAATSQ
ncbi:PBP1A family penicillin-binding protein [Candidatus Poribacteria bacterium]|nr:PBP1A family penicillin-binding protein [Candidatus Poribacteria bacterium]